jgi:hypothetical protein
VSPVSRVDCEINQRSSYPYIAKITLIGTTRCTSQFTRHSSRDLSLWAPPSRRLLAPARAPPTHGTASTTPLFSTHEARACRCRACGGGGRIRSGASAAEHVHGATCGDDRLWAATGGGGGRSSSNWSSAGSLASIDGSRIRVAGGGSADGEAASQGLWPASQDQGQDLELVWRHLRDTGPRPWRDLVCGDGGAACGVLADGVGPAPEVVRLDGQAMGAPSRAEPSDTGHSPPPVVRFRTLPLRPSKLSCDACVLRVHVVSHPAHSRG